MNQRKANMDLPQEVKDRDPTEVEVEVIDMEDTPKATRMKKRRNFLTSQKSNATIVRRWAIC